MIRVDSADNVDSLRLTTIDVILPGNLQRRLHSLGAGAQEEDLGEGSIAVGEDEVGQLLGRIGREEGRVRKGKRVRLVTHRLDHLLIAVANAGDSGATTPIEDLTAVSSDKVHPFPANGGRVLLIEGAVEEGRVVQSRRHVEDGFRVTGAMARILSLGEIAYEDDRETQTPIQE